MVRGWTDGILMTPRMQQALADMREAIEVIKHYCTGCTVMKSEGCRSYAASAPLKNGVCSHCGKPRYVTKR